MWSRSTLVLAALTLVGWSAEVEEGRKIALIIAISDYGVPPNHPVTGEPLRPYRPLNAANDVPLVRGALLHQGFLDEDIRVLTDADADVEGIREAFRWLVRETGEGDIVVLHYSGHGHRLTNDDPDEDEETDGYDELLVPYGAPDDFYEGYDGALHIRDDELGEVLTRVRERAGSAGNVTVFLDACYSGTGTRGTSELAARGSETPLGPPSGAAGGTAQDEADGTGIDRAAPIQTRGGEADLASFAVFSAASQRQVAYETWDVDGKTRVGSLSYAIARTLPEAAPGTTYRALFSAITRSLNGKVRQNPQMEGDGDARLFSNLLTAQFPYVEVSDAGPDGVSLSGGALLGLNPGTRLIVHAPGTAMGDPQTAFATLEVREASADGAVAEVVDGEVSAEAAGSWAFVSERTYGDLALRVRLDESLLQRDVDGMTRVLSETGIIELVQEAADVVVRDRGGLPEARTTQDDLELGVGAVDVVRVVEDFARNQYLRRLAFLAPDIDVRLDFSPVEIVRDRLGRATGCADPEWAPGRHPGAYLGGEQWAMSVGDAYRLRAVNDGDQRAFVAILDLMPKGAINVLRPREGEAPSSYELEGGDTLDLGCYQIADEVGHEVLKLFATRAPQDFRMMFETRGTRGTAGDLSALGALLGSTFTATRSDAVAQPSGTATTRSVLIRVSPQR